MRKLVPELALKIEGIFRRAGIDVVVLDNGACCGYPLILAGYEEKFAEIARKVMKKVENVEYNVMVVHCPGCLRAFKQFYPKVGFELPNIYHTTQVLTQLLSKGVLKLERRIELKVTYHDPCDLGRHLGIYEEPRKVILSIPGLTLTELPEIASRECSRCCGGGGLLRTLIPPLSSQVAVNRLIEDIADLGVQAVITACPTCLKTLRDALLVAEALYGVSMNVMDIADLVYEAMGRSP